MKGLHGAELYRTVQTAHTRLAVKKAAQAWWSGLVYPSSCAHKRCLNKVGAFPRPGDVIGSTTVDVASVERAGQRCWQLQDSNRVAARPDLFD